MLTYAQAIINNYMSPAMKSAELVAHLKKQILPHDIESISMDRSQASWSTDMMKESLKKVR